MVVISADAVDTGNAAAVDAFAPGAANRFDILHYGSDGDLGYWTGVQRWKVLLRDEREPATMNLRVTELFRRVDGE